jgi:hypothetical protein
MKRGETDYRGVGILYSRLSLSAFTEVAKRSNALYRFDGATGRVHWLRGEYAYLAPNGAASLLRRLCIKFDWLGDEDLLELKRIKRYHTLILPHAIALPSQAHKILSSWVDQGGFLFATGQIDLPKELLGLSEIKWYQPKGYTTIYHEKYHLIVGYRGYTVGICQTTSGSEVLASSYEILNTQEEGDGGKTYPLGPGVISTRQVLYIPLPLFETFGAMLQGHVNFEDIRSWGHRYKYLDWVGRFVKDLLEEVGWVHLWYVRLKPWGGYRGVVVLRHDVDGSKDTTYLDYERENQIPATYAILNDRHRKHWLKAVANFSAAEAAYHFDTGPGNLIRFIFKKKTHGKRLWKQIKKARDRLGIPIITSQRHKDFFYYPEIVDAMDYLYKKESGVLGLGTMFRFTNFMFGGKVKEGGYTNVVQHPDTSVPFWFPFKLWYTTIEKHHVLRGWDITHALEPEPWLTEHLLNQEDYLEEGVYTLGFHPAHCRGKSFRPEGNWDWFQYAVELGRSKGYLFTTCRGVFDRINLWENLDFGLYEDEGWIENRYSQDPVIIYLEHPKKKLLIKRVKGLVECVNPDLTKLVLAGGDSIHFSFE